MLPRIVASDLDGTLLRSDGTLSERTVRALSAVQAAGAQVVLCTARPVRWVRPIAAQAGAAGLAVCVNGAVIWDFAAETGVIEHAIDPAVVLDVVATLNARFPGGSWAVEHAHGFGHEPAYRTRWPIPDQTRVAPVTELLDIAPLKLLFRHDEHSADTLLIGAEETVGHRVELSHSNSADGLLEISAAGVDKGRGLARLCASLNAAAEDVIAFGDMPNDLSLLRWAGRAVAVGNAHPAVREAADEVAPANDEDGVATVLERMLEAVRRPVGRGRVPGTPVPPPPDRAPEIVFATAATLPIPDPETFLVVDALAQAGVRAEIVPWSADYPFAQVPLVVCRTTWDYLSRPDEFRAWITETAAATALENPAELMLWNLHKGYLAELGGAGVPVVATEMLDVGACPARRQEALARTGEIVIKPAVSAGSRDTLRVRAGDPAAAAHLEALLLDGDALVQPFLPEIADGEVSLIYFGGELSHAVRKTPDPSDWRVQVQYGGVNTVHTPEPAELAAADAALRALPALPLYARVDLVGADRPRVMEVELIEPQLFLALAPGAVTRYTEAVLARLRRRRALSARFRADPGPLKGN